MIPDAAFPPAISKISFVARLRPTSANPDLKLFSNLSVAWLDNSNVRAVRRLFTPSNVADSRSTVSVDSDISELAPPITPANPMPRSGSAIRSISVLSLRSLLSRVVSSSPDIARLTIIL